MLCVISSCAVFERAVARTLSLCQFSIKAFVVVETDIKSGSTVWR